MTLWFRGVSGILTVYKRHKSCTELRYFLPSGQNDTDLLLPPLPHHPESSKSEIGERVNDYVRGQDKMSHRLKAAGVVTAPNKLWLTPYSNMTNGVALAEGLSEPLLVE